MWLWRLHHYSVSGTDDDCTKSIPEAKVSRPWVPPNEVPCAEAYIPVVRGYVVLSCSDPSLTPARILKRGPSPLRAAPVEKVPSLLVKPSPTSTLPRVVSTTTLAAVEEGTDNSTAESPVSILTSASRERPPPKSSS